MDNYTVPKTEFSTINLGCLICVALYWSYKIFNTCQTFLLVL